MMAKLIWRNYTETDPFSTECSKITPHATCTLFNPPPRIISKGVENAWHSLQMSILSDSAANNTMSCIDIMPATSKDAGILRAPPYPS